MSYQVVSRQILPSRRVKTSTASNSTGTPSCVSPLNAISTVTVSPQTWIAYGSSWCTGYGTSTVE